MDSPTGFNSGFIFRENNTDKFLFDYNSNTTSGNRLADTFELYSYTSAQPVIRVHQSAGNTLNIDSSSNVVIGGTTAAQKFGVDTGGNTTDGYLSIQTGAGERLRIGYAFSLSAPVNNITPGQIFTDSNGILYLASRSSIASSIKLYTTASTTSILAMTIDSSQRVGIGIAPTSPFHVYYLNTATSGTIVGAQITPTYNQASGTAANTDFLINRTQTAVGSGSQYLIDAQVGGVTKFNVDNNGNIIAAGNVHTSNLKSSATSGITNALAIIGGNSNGNTTANMNKITMATGTASNTSGAGSAVYINPTYNQLSGTASNTDFLVNRVQTAVGSGAQLLADFQVGGVSKWNVTNLGTVTQSMLSLASTPTDGLFITNETAATVGSTIQMSPRLRLRGRVWNSDLLTSNTEDWSMDVLPVSGTTPYSSLRLGNSAQGGAYSYVFTLSPTSAAFSTTLSSTSTFTNTRSGIASTSADGIIVTNSTAATVGAQVQMSPRIRLSGNAWKSNSTAVSQTQDWIIENLPATGAASTSSTLKFCHSNNGASYTEQMTLNVSGSLINSPLTINGTFITDGGDIETGGGSINIDGGQVFALRPAQYATGSLPTAASNEGVVAYDTDTQSVKFCDGSEWAEMGGGAVVGGNGIVITSGSPATLADGDFHTLTHGTDTNRHRRARALGYLPEFDSFATKPTTATRNDSDFTIGMGFSVSQTITVTEFGRLYVAGNSQDHEIYLWISTDSVTPLATETILNASSSDGDDFKWVTLGTPVVLEPGNIYYLCGNEFGGGDTWKDGWTPGTAINSVLISVHDRFAATLDTFPTNGGSAGQIYNTMSMKFQLGDGSLNGKEIQFSIGSSEQITVSYGDENGDDADTKTTFINNMGAELINPVFVVEIGGSELEETIGVMLDGGGSVITTGSKGYRRIPYDATIEDWAILSDVTGSIVIDVKKCDYSGWPTTSSIAGSEKPTLSSATKNQDVALSTWTTAITAGDMLEFVVDSASTLTKVWLYIKIKRA